MTREKISFPKPGDSVVIRGKPGKCILLHADGNFEYIDPPKKLQEKKDKQ